MNQTKQKTKKAVVKRFKYTVNGKIVRRRQMAGHLKAAKSRTAKNRYKRTALVSKVDSKVIERLMPYNAR